MRSLQLEVELGKGSSFAYDHRIRNGDRSFERVRVVRIYDGFSGPERRVLPALLIDWQRSCGSQFTILSEYIHTQQSDEQLVQVGHLDTMICGSGNHNKHPG